MDKYTKQRMDKLKIQRMDESEINGEKFFVMFMFAFILLFSLTIVLCATDKSSDESVSTHSKSDDIIFIDKNGMPSEFPSY
jgi:cell division protein FtsL